MAILQEFSKFTGLLTRTGTAPRSVWDVQLWNPRFSTDFIVSK